MIEIENTRQILIEKAPILVQHMVYENFYMVRLITKIEYDLICLKLKKIEDSDILVDWNKFKRKNIYVKIGRHYSGGVVHKYENFEFLFKSDFVLS
jgi:hypothetical protein